MCVCWGFSGAPAAKAIKRQGEVRSSQTPMVTACYCEEGTNQEWPLVIDQTLLAVGDVRLGQVRHC